MRILIASILFLSFGLKGQELSSFTTDTLLMGVSFSFTALHQDKEKANNSINAAINEVVRIERLISSWDENSQTARINRNAGKKKVSVDQELIELIERSIKVSQITNGYFDITFASLDRIWKFGDYKTESIPSKEDLASSVAKINFENILIDKTDLTVFLKEEGMKIGFGAIGKGYAANRAKHIMHEKGIQNGVVNAGGDLLNWGADLDGKPWTVGIVDPKNNKEVISTLNVSDLAIVTSGNYEKFVEIDGRRYSHIINPKSGMPVEDLSSVTVICPDAELADALATSVFVLGKEDGMKLINHLESVECIIVDEQKNILTSKNINQRIWLK